MQEIDVAALECTTERLHLKVLSATFAPQVLRYFEHNAAFRQPWSPIPPAHFLTLAHQRQRLTDDWTAMERGASVRLWLFKRDDAALATILGFVSLSNIVRGAFQSCNVGYEMSSDQLNQGYITEALRAVIELAFGAIRLHRLEANIMPRNVRSLRVVEKLGFVAEGLARKYLKINGVWEDHQHYVLLNADLE